MCCGSSSRSETEIPKLKIIDLAIHKNKAFHIPVANLDVTLLVSCKK